MVKYTLPDLPYDYSALEPHYSAKLLALHHDKHHAGYVTGANATLEKPGEARAKGDFTAINQLEKSLAFHLSGHVLHSLLWKNLSPSGGGEPDGELAAAVKEFFGSFTVISAEENERAGSSYPRSREAETQRRVFRRRAVESGTVFSPGFSASTVGLIKNGP